MFTVTLISRPLDPALVESLRNAWGGGDALWLAPDEAAEFQLAHEPANFWQVWADLQPMRVDLVCQPTKGRRKALLLADMDSTMIQQECIDQLADVAGVGPHVAAITARAMNGEIDFEAALTERVGLLKGLDSAVIETVIEQRITMMPGAGTLLATMKAQGAVTALVSGGFTAFTGHVAARLGFDSHRANRLEIAQGRLTGRVIPPILGRQAKVQALHELTAQHGLVPDQVVAVGDGANDLGMLQLAGAGVALHAKPVVAAQVARRINFGDLTALLYLQGYARAEFR